MGPRASLLTTLLLSTTMFAAAMNAQVIPFESGGLSYKALTRGGVTIMFAPLSLKIQNYAVLQIAISNGSPVSWTFKPEDFRFEPEGGGEIAALPAVTVVMGLLKKAGRTDVSKLVTAYEATLYGNTEFHSTNGYEARRQDAMAINGGKLRAAAAASAICLVVTKLAPGQSTDGAVFYPNAGKPLGAGQLMVHAAAEDFVFPFEPLTPQPHSGH
jgi:hypothetical protein